MNEYDDEYDPKEDPIWLQRREIDTLEIVIEKLIVLIDHSDMQTNTLYSMGRHLKAINAKLNVIGVILAVIALILIFK